MFNRIQLKHLNDLSELTDVTVILTEKNYIPYTEGIFIPLNHPQFEALMGTLTRRLQQLQSQPQTKTTPLRSASPS